MNPLLKKDPGHRYEIWVEKENPMPDGSMMKTQTIMGWSRNDEAKNFQEIVDATFNMKRLLVFDRLCSCQRIMTHANNIHLVCPGCAKTAVMAENRRTVDPGDLEKYDVLIQAKRGTIVVHMPVIAATGVLGELGGVIKSEHADCIHLEWEDWGGQRRCIGCGHVVGLSGRLQCKHNEKVRPDGSSVCTKCGAEWNLPDAKQPIRGR